jgi:sterol-4alpha-carboxylate 3-dehydrogenase (decarboxylating)
MSRNIISALITGGSGFVGAAIAECLLARHPQCQVHILDLIPPTSSSPLQGHPRVSYHDGSILDPKSLTETFQKLRPQVVFHTAGLIPAAARRLKRRSRKDYFELNVQGTTNVAEISKDSNVEAFIYTSSVQAISASPWSSYTYRNESSTPIPSTFTNYYAESKALAETKLLSLLEKNTSPKLCILRLSVLFGPGDTSLVPALYDVMQIPLGGNIILGNGENMYDITHVKNAAHAHVLAAENLVTPDLAQKDSAAGQTFFISNLEPIRFREFMLATWAQFGYVPRWSMNISAKLAYGALWSIERLMRPFGVVWDVSPGEVVDGCSERWFDCTKAVEILGYQPVLGLDEAIRDACDAHKLALTQSRFG